MRKNKDFYWLVGILEGEGCFRLAFTSQNKEHTKVPKIQLAMTDQDIVERAAKILQTNVMGPYRGSKGQKLIYQLLVSGNKAIEIMVELLPYMGKRRSDKIIEILDYWIINYKGRKKDNKTGKFI